MDGEEPPARGDDLLGTPPRTPPILGRVSVGVGSPPPRSISVGTMVRPGDLTPHQHSGDESFVPGTSDLPGRGHQPVSNGNVRQLHSSSLRLQGGGGGGAVSDSLCELTGQLLRWTETHNVLLEARYLLGQSNVLADLLSRRNHRWRRRSSAPGDPRRSTYLQHTSMRSFPCIAH